MKEKMLEELTKSKELAEINKRFCEFMAGKETDEQIKAQWKVKADSYQTTIDEKIVSIKNFEDFLQSDK